jgi:hypothetical protein
MTGHVRRRGKASWELKFEAGRDPVTGERKIAYHSFRGTKRDAQIKLAELVVAVGGGSYVEPSKTTVADFVRARVDQWEAAGAISARTAQRYRQLVENQIAPHLGALALQKLRPLDIESWHTTLRTSGSATGGALAARTIGHAHRVLVRREADRAAADAGNGRALHRNAPRRDPRPAMEPGRP